MWLWGEQWEEKEKKKKKKVAAIPRWTSFIYRCPPLVHWISTRIEWAIERDAGWQPQSGNRANFRPVRSDSVLLRSTLNFASFLPFFFFFLPIEKTRRKGRKRNESKRTFERLVREIVASPLSSLLRTYFRSRIAKEWFEWRRLKSRFLFPSPFHSRAEYTSERKFPAPVTFSRASSMESRFLKGSGMGETREIFNRNRLDP